MNGKAKAAVRGVRLLSIGALSRATRIPAETLRTWERRYGAPMPVRKPSGHRLYPAASVEQLRRVERLLSQGHRPGEILGLPVRDLDAMLALVEGRGSDAPTAAVPALPTAESLERSIRGMTRAAEVLDRASLMRELHANWARLGPLQFLRQCAGRFMIEVGSAWHDGVLDIQHEHFAFACLSDFLREAREPYDHEARGPRVLAALLPGEGHEGGLLMVSVALALRGYRVVYLGANIPIARIAAAARESNAEAVAISVSSATRPARAKKAIALLREALPGRVPLWVGGAGAPKPTRGVERFETLEDLDERLTARA
jgi:methanogenic corrinoid protein MtbC1